MKSVKQNTIQQSIDRHEITLVESKQPFTTNKDYRYISVFIIFATKQTEVGRTVQATAVKRID